MRAQYYAKQITKLIKMVEQGQGDEADTSQLLNASEYLDQARLDREKAMFRRLPLLIAHSSELANVGDFVVRELDSRSWLLVRGDDGVARAFYNYCQHRGTKLVHESAGCKKRFTCPYHAWTYGVKGNLLGVPRADLFPDLDKENRGLKSATLEETFGFLWLTQDAEHAVPMGSFLGPELSDEMTEMDLASYSVFFDKTRDLKANWKFPLFAFLEPYHINVLHKDSIGDYFVENVAHSERFGPHIRSFVPRKNILELADADLNDANFAEYVTPSNIYFPNICTIAHPTSVSVISMFPGDTPGDSHWRHMLLVPNVPKTDAERAHFQKTVDVLDGITYEKEDFWASEQIQEGINAGAIDELLLAKNEMMLKVFNDLVDEWSAK